MFRSICNECYFVYTQMTKCNTNFLSRMHSVNGYNFRHNFVYKTNVQLYNFSVVSFVISSSSSVNI